MSEKTISKLELENAILKEFAQNIIKDICWNYPNELDGGEIQDYAEKLGLIKSAKATQEDVDDGMDLKVGDNVFKFSEILK